MTAVFETGPGQSQEGARSIFWVSQVDAGAGMEVEYLGFERVPIWNADTSVRQWLHSLHHIAGLKNYFKIKENVATCLCAAR